MTTGDETPNSSNSEPSAHEPANHSNESVTPQFGPSAETLAYIEQMERIAQAKRRKRTRLALIGAVVIAIAVGGWWISGAQERNYLNALKAQNLHLEYANEQVALAQGTAFCEALRAGKEAVGFKREKVAVDVFCSEFAAGFTVIPTPEEQQATLLNELRTAGLGGLYSSDAEAVSKAKAVCAALESGGKPQGVKADFIGVQVYCPDFAGGFRVLEEIVVVGTMTIYSESSYYPSIRSSGGRCEGAGGYSDIDEGTAVTIRNGEGVVLDESELLEGRGSSWKCVFKFKLKVLEGEKRYKIEVGRRGSITYTEAQLKIPNHVRVFLG